jgi:hypothetical protein
MGQCTSHFIEKQQVAECLTLRYVEPPASLVLLFIEDRDSSAVVKLLLNTPAKAVMPIATLDVTLGTVRISFLQGSK